MKWIAEASPIKIYFDKNNKIVNQLCKIAGYKFVNLVLFYLNFFVCAFWYCTRICFLKINFYWFDNFDWAYIFLE